MRRLLLCLTLVLVILLEKFLICGGTKSIVKYFREVGFTRIVSVVPLTPNLKFRVTQAIWEYTFWLHKRNKSFSNTICCIQIKYLLTSVGAFAKLRKATVILACLFVCPSEWNNSDRTGRNFVKFCVPVFFENLWRITGILHEDQCSFMVASRWILRKMRNISEVVEKIKHAFSGNLTVYWVMWQNMVQADRP